MSNNSVVRVDLAAARMFAVSGTARFFANVAKYGFRVFIDECT